MRSSYLMLSSDPVGAPALHLKAALYFTLKDKHKMVIFVVESCCQNGMNSWSRDGWRHLRNLSKSTFRSFELIFDKEFTGPV